MKSKLTKITLLLLVLVMVLACVVACGKDKTYKITIMDGETEIATFDVKPGETLSKEDILAKMPQEEFKLYFDAEFNEEFSFDKEILDSVTLYVKYTQKTLYINVKQGAGESEVPRVEVRNGEAYTVPIPSKEGYDFAGYTYLDDEENERAFSTTGTYNFTTNIRLTAHWTKKHLTVTFKGEDEAVLATQENVEYGAKATAITVDGYTVDGYYLDKECTEANKITLSAYEVKDNISVYVKKTARTYTLSVAGWHEATIQVTYGQTYTLIAPEDTTNAIYQAKIGTDADNEWSAFTGYTYQGAAFAVTGVYTYAENIEVIPVYTENPDYNKATVTFWDTVNNVAFKAVTISRGATVALTEFPVTAKTGYEFGGWFTNQSYAQESAFTAGVQVNENVRVYAKYTAKSFTITVKDTNASGAVLETIDVTYGVAFSVTDPTKFGFTFQKYVLGTEDFDPTDHATYDIDDDIVLFAIFTAAEAGSDLFVKDATNGYFKERASVSDPFTYVFLTGREYSFGDYTLASAADGTNIDIIQSATKFRANTPGEFSLTLTAVNGGAQTTIAAKIVYNITSFAIGGSYDNMIINAAKELSFRQTVAEADYVMDAGVEAFIPELVIMNDKYAAINLEEANVVVEMKNATGGALEANYNVSNGSSLTFNNAGNVYTAEEKVTLVFKPKYVFDNKQDSLTVKFNTGVNVYTNEQLRAAYGNTGVQCINVLRNITAVLDEASYVSGYGTTGDITLTASNGSTVVLEDWDLGQPRNWYRDGVYRRRTSNQSDNLVINGNYFAIDGRRLPYMDNDISNRTGGVGYDLAEVQIGIFMYSCAEFANIDAKRDINVRYAGGNVTFNNLKIEGNNQKQLSGATASVQGRDLPMLKMSASYGGIVVRGGTLNLNNTTITNVCFGMMLDGGVSGYEKPTYAQYSDSETQAVKVFINNSLINNCWSNDIYDFNLAAIDIRNTILGSCCGAAIHIDNHPYADPDTYGGTANEGTAYTETEGYSKMNSTLVMDNFTAKNIQNWVVGDEAWFVAYGKSSAAAMIKTDMESGVSAAGLTILREISGVNKMNFAILVNPCGGTWSYDKDGQVKLDATVFDVPTKPIAFFYGSQEELGTVTGGLANYSSFVTCQAFVSHYEGSANMHLYIPAYVK